MALESGWANEVSAAGKIGSYQKPKIKYMSNCEICNTQISKYYLKEHMQRIHKITDESEIQQRKERKIGPPTFFADGKNYCSFCFANLGTLVEVSDDHNCKFDQNKQAQQQNQVVIDQVLAQAEEIHRKSKSPLKASLKKKMKNSFSNGSSSVVEQMLVPQSYDMQPKGYYLPADKGFCEICEKPVSKYYLKDHMLRKHQIENFSLCKYKKDPNVLMPQIMMKPKKPVNEKDKSYCDICEKMISKYYLREHMKRIHQIDYEIESPNGNHTYHEENGDYDQDYGDQDYEYDPDIICADYLEPEVQIENVEDDDEQNNHTIDDNNYESAEDFVCEPDIIQHGSDSEPEMPEEENEPNPESCPEDDDLILGL